MKILNKEWSDEFTCHCGNDIMGSGFQACNDQGVEVEPTPEAWKSDLTVCLGCGQVYKFDTAKYWASV